MKQALTFVGAAVTALAASACCILPAVLGVAGVGALGAGAALEPYRPLLMPLTVLLLGAGFYFTYRPAKSVCDAQGHCSTSSKGGGRRGNKALLWAVSALTLGAMFYPQLAQSAASGSVPVAAVASPPRTGKTSNLKTVVFSIGNMTCATCVPGLASALRNTPGVKEAQVDFASRRATLRYDRSRVSTATLRAAVRRAGFTTT